ncbi:MAG: Bug family tripartite tricarboxylate transporter substrate binding protein [Burkholderiales bacterium]
MTIVFTSEKHLCGTPRQLLIACTSSLLIPLSALSQSYPTKPVRIIVPFSTGSLPDLVPRLVGEKLSPMLGQPVIVENRIGAGGRIGADAVAKAVPDGYTLLLGTASTQVVAPHLVKTMPYDTFRDFTPIINLASAVTGFVVSASVPANSAREVIEYARKNPGKIAYGSNGIGSSHHLRGEQIKIVANIDMLHVPFGGAAEIVTGLANDTVQLSFSTPSSVLPHVQVGRMKLLALTSPKRLASLPNTPTLEEVLPGFESTVDWFGFFGPPNLPRAIVTRLNGDVARVLDAPDLRTKFESQAMVTVSGSPEDFAAMIKRDFSVYAKVVKAVGIQAQ